MATVPAWYADFVAEVVAQLPRDIDEATARGWLQDPQGLASFLAGLRSSAPGTSPAVQGPPPLKYDKSAEGWELVEDATGPAHVRGEDLVLAQFFEDGAQDLFGDPMVQHVRGLEGRLGQRHAEYFLEHQDEIPEEFKRNSLVFAGTIWLGRDGNHHVPCLIWSQGKWDIQFGILEAGVDSGDYLVRART